MRRTEKPVRACKQCEASEYRVCRECHEAEVYGLSYWVSPDVSEEAMALGQLVWQRILRDRSHPLNPAWREWLAEKVKR